MAGRWEGDQESVTEHDLKIKGKNGSRERRDQPFQMGRTGMRTGDRPWEGPEDRVCEWPLAGTWRRACALRRSQWEGKRTIGEGIGTQKGRDRWP